jgi:hypothetical protein
LILALTEKEIEELKLIANPDAGLSGRRFSTFDAKYGLDPAPGLANGVDMFSLLFQDLSRNSTPLRIDDGVTGERVARIIHVEKKDPASCPDIETINELKEMLTEEQKQEFESGDGLVYVFYCIPAGGTATSNEIPSALSSGGSPNEIDYAKIINYPRFYSILNPVSSDFGDVLTAAVGKTARVEFLDRDEHRYGVFKGLVGETSQGPASGGGGSGGPGGPSVPSPSGAFVGGSARITPATMFNMEDFASIGPIPGSKSFKTDPIPEGIPLPPAYIADVKRGVNPKTNRYYFKPSKANRKPETNKLRADIEAQFQKAMKVPRELGVPICTSGGLVQRGGGRPGSTSLHTLGRAIDFNTNLLIEHKGNYQDNQVLYIASPEPGNSGKFRFYARAGVRQAFSDFLNPGAPSTPAVPNKRILAWIPSNTRGGHYLEYVEGPFVDMTHYLELYGFSRIGSLKGFPGTRNPLQFYGGALSEGGRLVKGYGDPKQQAEWWHYQFTKDLVRRKSNFADEFLKVYGFGYTRNYFASGKTIQSKLGGGRRRMNRSLQEMKDVIYGINFF